MNKPFYLLKVELFGCVYYLFVNDILVLSSRKGKGISSRIPINQYLNSGKNLIEIKLSPLPGELSLDKRTEFAISALKQEDGSKNFEEIPILVSPEYSAEKPIINDRLSGFFNLHNNPFPDPLWLQCEDLRNKRNIVESINAIYTTIHHYLQMKNVSQILILMEKRIEELAKCLYMSEEEVRQSAREGIQDNTDGNGWVLQDLNLNAVTLKFYGNGRLGRLEDENGKSPIRYRDEENKLNTTYDFFFCLHPASHEFIIIR